MARYQFPGPGPGRPKGLKNKRTLMMAAALAEHVPDEKLVLLLWKLALDGNVQAAVELANRKWGRVSFQTDLQLNPSSGDLIFDVAVAPGSPDVSFDPPLLASPIMGPEEPRHNGK